MPRNTHAGSRSPRPPDVLALADDTAGALEIGAQFAAAGVPSLVTIDSAGALVCSAPALVVDTQTRRLAPSEARQRVSHWASAARQLGLPHLYKKTDSTLRGNIPEEFEALLAAYPEKALIYVPAYPKLGRVVVNGRLRLPAGDPLSPPPEDSIPALLAGRCPAPVIPAATSEELAALLRTDLAGAIVVCDGNTDADLAAVAELLGRSKAPHVAAGPGGFAGHWIRHLDVPRSARPGPPSVRRCLVVSGSLHPVSRGQISRGAQGGIPTYHLGPDCDGAAIADELMTAIAGHRWATLGTAEPVGGCAFEVANRIGGVVRQVLASGVIDGLVIFGGDTAFAVLSAAGSTVIEACGELLPGIPISRFRHGGREIGLVTKAGGFGSPDVLRLIREALEKAQ